MSYTYINLLMNYNKVQCSTFQPILWMNSAPMFDLVRRFDLLVTQGTQCLLHIYIPFSIVILFPFHGCWDFGASFDLVFHLSLQRYGLDFDVRCVWFFIYWCGFYGVWRDDQIMWQRPFDAATVQRLLCYLDAFCGCRPPAGWMNPLLLGPNTTNTKPSLPESMIIRIQLRRSNMKHTKYKSIVPKCIVVVGSI